MLNEHQEEELADWWGEHLGLYDKSNEMYRRKVKKDRLIADKAEEMGMQGFNAKMLAGWMKSMIDEDDVWQGGEEGQGEVWGCSPRPHL